jgi:hypothetical protein
MKKPSKIIFKLLNFAIVFMLFGCEKDLYDDKIYQSKINVERISLKDSKSSFKIHPNLLKAVSKVNAKNPDSADLESVPIKRIKEKRYLLDVSFVNRSKKLKVGFVILRHEESHELLTPRKELLVRCFLCQHDKEVESWFCHSETRRTR